MGAYDTTEHGKQRQVLPTNYSFFVVDSAPQLRQCPVMDDVHFYLWTGNGC